MRTELREVCPACNGAGEVPCDCHLCRSPEGRACGVMGHVERQCPECLGHRELSVPCSGCGLSLYEETMVVGFGGDAYCPDCETEYATAPSEPGRAA